MSTQEPSPPSDSPAPRRPTLYWEYIKVEELLALQSGLSDTDARLSNDEVMFIVVHQVDELWFKLVLRELVTVRDLFSQPHVPETALASAVRSLRRVVVLFSQLSNHFELMETLTTRDYLAFRDKLSPASGFQSAQLREIEVLLGLNDDERIPLGHEGSYQAALKHPGGEPSPALARLKARLDESVTLHSALNDWLYRTPIQGSTPDQTQDETVVDTFLNEYLQAVEREGKNFTVLAMRDALTPQDQERLQLRHERGMASARAFLHAEDVTAPMRPREKRCAPRWCSSKVTVNCPSCPGHARWSTPWSRWSRPCWSFASVTRAWWSGSSGAARARAARRASITSIRQP